MVGDGRTANLRRRRKLFAGNPPGRHRHQHGIDLHLGGALGEIDRVAHGLFGIDQIDHRTGLHAACAGMGKADNLDGVAAAAQRLALRIGS